MFDNNQLISAYANNPLISACGPILDPHEIGKALTHLPELPRESVNLPFYIRKHIVPSIRDLFIPNPVCISLAESVDVMIRQGYSKTRPGTSEFWKSFYCKTKSNTQAPACAATLVGISGAGKTISIERILNLYPQYHVHQSLPGYIGKFTQLIWLKVDAPKSGKLGDLAYDLMLATNQALGTEYFEASLKKEKRPPTMFDEWVDIANKHMLGFLVIDEIQNFFKLEPKKERLRNKTDDKLEIRIADNQTLNSIVNFTNKHRIPLLASGTPDGLAIFRSRLSTSQRLTTGGHHQLDVPSTADDKHFSNTIFPIFTEYQWVKNKVQKSEELRDLFFDLTACIPRVYTNLWVVSHKVAYEKGEDALSKEIIIEAMNSYMKPVIPAIEALKSNNPNSLKKYEDLYPRDHHIWRMEI